MKKTRIQMYENKQAYICMIKTRIQMYEQNTYKCMKKTGIQMYEKNSLIYWSGGQPISVPREHGGTVRFPRAPQL